MMTTSWRIRRFGMTGWLVAGLWLAGCLDHPTEPRATTGALRVRAVTLAAPTDLDPDGYTFRVDSGPWEPLPASGWLEPRLGPGDYSVALGGASPNCAVQGVNPRSARVGVGDTAEVSFVVACAPLALHWPGFVSDPVASGSASFSSGALSSGTVPGVAYVSLPSGTIPHGEMVTITNRTTGATLSAAMVDGGFDPLPVPAGAGDALDIEVRVVAGVAPLRFAYLVTATRPPVVVRTEPPPRKRDVPLNAVMLIVFSEPIDPATLTSTSVQLLQGTTPIASRLASMDAVHLTATLEADIPLVPGTDYALLITQWIRDLDGEPLEDIVRVDFTTVPPVATVHVDADTASILVGDSARLTVLVTDSAGNELADRTVEWSSTAPGIASVSAVGQILGKAVGFATILAFVEGKADSVAITVTSVPVASLSVSPPAESLLVNDSIQLTAEARDAAGNVLPDRMVVWLSSDSTTATVTSTGVVHGRSPGSAMVIGSLEGQVDTATITVLALPVSPATQVVFTIQPTNATAGAAIAPAVQVTAQDAGGQTITSFFDSITIRTIDGGHLPGSIEWSRIASMTATVAAVAGVATFPNLRIGVSGTAYRLVAGAGGTPYDTSAAFDVGIPTVASIGLTPDTVRAAPTGSANVAFRATLRDAGGADVTGSVPVSWASSDPSVAEVLPSDGDPVAHIWSLGPTGPVTITATAGGQTATATVLLDSVQFTAVATRANGTLWDACFLTTGGAAMCSGQYNSRGQLGYGIALENPSQLLGPVAVTGDLAFKAISAGAWHTCALTLDGLAYCWGFDGQGQLGSGMGMTCYPYGSLLCSAAPVAVSGGLRFAQISAGYGHTCALTSAGTVYCWGANWAGQLGTGTTNSSPVPIQAASGLVFTEISAGAYHTCGIASDRTAYCWGLNENGALGDGSSVANQLNPVPVAGGNNFDRISAGRGVTCGLTNDGTAYCWGQGYWGALGDGTRIDRSTPVAVAVAGGLTFTQISQGHTATCGLAVGGDVYCWGFTGDYSQAEYPIDTLPVRLPTGLTFVSLDSQNGATCGVASDDRVYCWTGTGWWFGAFAGQR